MNTQTNITTYSNTVSEYMKLINSRVKQYTKSNKIPELEFELNVLKTLVVMTPNIESKYLDFYTSWLKEEFDDLKQSDTLHNLEYHIRFLTSTFDKIQKLESNKTTNNPMMS